MRGNVHRAAPRPGVHRRAARRGDSVYLATEHYSGLLSAAPADATNDATLIAGGTGPGGGTRGTPSDPSDPNCTVKQVSDVVDSFGRNRLAEYLDTGGQANLSFYHPDTNALLVYYVPNTGSAPVPNAIMIVNADYTMTLVRYRNHPTNGPTTTSVTSPTYIMSPSDIEDLNTRLLQADAAHTDASDGPIMSLREAILADIESRALTCTTWTAAALTAVSSSIEGPTPRPSIPLPTAGVVRCSLRSFRSIEGALQYS